MRRIIVAGTALLATAALSAPALAHDVDIDVLSSRPNHVSGGDALIRVQSRHRDDLRITRNGDDVTGAFDGRGIGLVDGLRLGRNRISAWDGRHPVATLRIRNFPIEGPIFSGPH